MANEIIGGSFAGSKVPGTLTVVYTVPAGVRVAVATIYLNNTDPSDDVTVGIYVTRSGSTTERIYKPVLDSDGGSAIAKIMALSTGDTIELIAGKAGVVSFTISGASGAT